MKFETIIKSNSWLSIETIFCQLFPKEISAIEEYEEVFKELKMMEPVDTNISIILSHEIDDFDNEEYVNVSGYYNDHPKENGLTESLALEFTPWNEWLGMEIDSKTLSDFSELELICHCLFEMTFFSFDQKKIQEEIERIHGMVEDIKNMSEDEKKEKLIPFEKVKEMLFKKDQENQTPPNEPSADNAGDSGI
jgi:hypothetical protein